MTKNTARGQTHGVDPISYTGALLRFRVRSFPIAQSTLLSTSYKIPTTLFFFLVEGLWRSISFRDFSCDFPHFLLL